MSEDLYSFARHLGGIIGELGQATDPEAVREALKLRGQMHAARLREVNEPGTPEGERLVAVIETVFLVAVERAIVAYLSGDRLRSSEEELRALACCEALDIGAARLRAGDMRGARASFERAEVIVSEPAP